MLRRRRSSQGPRLRLFFATDIHGSDQCFRKWLNAAAVYDVDLLILGGDVTGKSLVPLVETGAGWEGDVLGERVCARGEPELAALQDRLWRIGIYDAVVTPEEKQELDAGGGRLEAAFLAAMKASLKRWARIAEERFDGKRPPGLVMLGNDDPPELAECLQDCPALEYCDDALVRVQHWEVISLGLSTPTPWQASEEELSDHLETLVAQLERTQSAILNLHCPPIDTHLDQAPKLDDQLRPVIVPGGMAYPSVRSIAVRSMIERVQPLLGLRERVHEGTGTAQLGRTLAINPGSEYTQGTLLGAIPEIGTDEVHRWQLTRG